MPEYLTGFLSLFPWVNIAVCWRASDNTAAMLDDKTRYKSVFRPWELIELFIQAHFTKTMDFVN